LKVVIGEVAVSAGTTVRRLLSAQEVVVGKLEIAVSRE